MKMLAGKMPPKSVYVRWVWKSAPTVGLNMSDAARPVAVAAVGEAECNP